MCRGLRAHSGGPLSAVRLVPCGTAQAGTSVTERLSRPRMTLFSGRTGWLTSMRSTCRTSAANSAGASKRASPCQAQP